MPNNPHQYYSAGQVKILEITPPLKKPPPKPTSQIIGARRNYRYLILGVPCN